MLKMTTIGTFPIDRDGYMQTACVAYDESAGTLCFRLSEDGSGETLDRNTATIQIKPEVLARALAYVEAAGEQAEMETPYGDAALDDEGTKLLFTAPCGDRSLVDAEDVRAILKAFAPQTPADDLPVLNDAQLDPHSGRVIVEVNGEAVWSFDMTVKDPQLAALRADAHATA